MSEDEMTDVKCFTLQETADILSVSRHTILRMIERDEIVARKVGGQWRFTYHHLRQYLGMDDD